MKYYNMHEEVYQELMSGGFVSWDKATNLQELLCHDINIALNKNLTTFFPKFDGLSSLDIGTGTGAAALNLAKLGFKSTGYDISNTAIELARKNASGLNVEAKFQVRDLVLEDHDDSFDLIVDSSFLHCIVPDEERGNVYRFVRNSLTRDGMFFVHTMVQAENMSEMLSRDYLLHEGDILWSAGRDKWDMQWHEVAGKRVFPHRRILTINDLKKEFYKFGFEMAQEFTNENQNNPSIYTAWLRPRQL